MALGYLWHVYDDPKCCSLKESSHFEKWMQTVCAIWFGLLAGTLITAIIHSSAATLAILITLLESYSTGAGWMPTAVNIFPVIMGANLGPPNAFTLPQR